MPVSTKLSPTEGINPYYLYTPEELSPLCGLTARQITRLMDERRIPFTLVGSHRGRRISGKQYMEWVESRAVEEVGA